MGMKSENLKSKGASMFGILFRVKAKPGKYQELIDFLNWDGDVCRDLELGTLRFDFYFDPNEKDTLYVYEAYRDKNAFEEHQRNEPYQKWEDIVRDLTVGVRVLFRCDALWSPLVIMNVIEYEARWISGLNRRNVSVADEVFDPDCKIYITGREEPICLKKFKEIVEEDIKGLPANMKFEIKDEIISGNKFAYRWEAKGSDLGKSIRHEGLIIDHVANGKVIERWEKLEEFD
ncbi:MAG: ester cyclase [Candidatus Scalindua sp.]|nr:ester cyclase [Candidatus Scalindua sp.]